MLKWKRAHPIPVQQSEITKNIGINHTEEKVILVLLETPDASAVEIAENIGVTKRTLERTLKKLQDIHKIVRPGSKKIGHWIVLE